MRDYDRKHLSHEKYSQTDESEQQEHKRADQVKRIRRTTSLVSGLIILFFALLIYFAFQAANDGTTSDSSLGVNTTSETINSTNSEAFFKDYTSTSTFPRNQIATFLMPDVVVSEDAYIPTIDGASLYYYRAPNDTHLQQNFQVLALYESQEELNSKIETYEQVLLEAYTLDQAHSHDPYDKSFLHHNESVAINILDFRMLDHYFIIKINIEAR
jgi:hypothetical protein